MTEDDRGPLSPIHAADAGDVSVRPARMARVADQDQVDRQFAVIVKRSLSEPELPLTESTDSADSAVAPVRWQVAPSRVTFGDVCGLESTKRRLHHLFAAGGRGRRSGALLYGPAGCGKSLLGRALAGELGAGFVQVRVADLIRPTFGAEADDITALFDLIHASGPVVLLLDGIDALALDGPGRELAERLAGELCSLPADGNVVVLASTDRPWLVHPLLRSTPALRDALFVPAPTRRARRELFKVLLPSRTSPGVSLHRLARCTGGLSGADIASICAHAGEEAAMDAIAGHPRLIKMADLAAANAQTPRTVAEWSQVSRQARQAA